jgi:hypothetical protein
MEKIFLAGLRGGGGRFGWGLGEGLAPVKAFFETNHLTYGQLLRHAAITRDCIHFFTSEARKWLTHLPGKQYNSSNQAHGVEECLRKRSP